MLTFIFCIEILNFDYVPFIHSFIQYVWYETWTNFRRNKSFSKVI